MTATPYALHRQLRGGHVVVGGRKLCWHRYSRTDVVCGVWRYRACRCGRRVATRLYWDLFWPIDWDWLEGRTSEPSCGLTPSSGPPRPGGPP